MKKIFYSAGLLLLWSCGGESAEGDATTDSTGTTEETGIPVDNSILDPSKDDLSGVLTVDQLVNSMNVYYGKEVQLVVYPTVYVDGDPFKQDMSATATPDAFEKVAVLKFTAVPTEKVTKGQPYLVKGIIESIGYSGELYMIDVSLGTLPADYKTEPFNPKAISSAAIYSPSDVQASIKAWDQKVVTVTGDYKGTTVSKSADGKELLDARVDLGQSGVEYRVGCSFATEEETTVFVAGQTGVKIKGAVNYKLSWSSPRLENCQVVN